MDLLIQINHLANFVLPAWGLALFMLGASWLRHRKSPLRTPYWAQFALHGGLGTAVLAGGLIHFGADGKMATYAALAVVAASLQWLLERGWKA